MIVSKDKRFIFCGAERCATTSIQLALKKYNSYKIKGGVKTRPEDIKKSGENLRKHLPFRSAERYIDGFDGYTKFCVFRNPWEMAVSKYKWLSDRRKYISKIPFLTWIQHPSALNPDSRSGIKNYKEFVSAADGTVLTDIIFNFNSLPGLEGFFAFTFGVDITLKQVNASQHRPYQEYYNVGSDAIEHIRDRFSWSIELMGFTFEGKEAEGEKAVCFTTGWS